MNSETHNSIANKRTYISQWYFNPVLLSMYDFFVYRFISRFIWGCPNKILINRYKYYVDHNHLEVGVGTGYLLDSSNPININLDLLDLSKSCLYQSNKRLSRYQPALIRHNILEKPLEEDKRYDSIGINYVMHCVAGDYKSKGIVFKNLKDLLKTKGVIFGSAVIKTEQSTLPARFLMKFLNTFGVFSNSKDKIQDLDRALKNHFKYVKLNIKSSVVLFVVSDNKNII